MEWNIKTKYIERVENNFLDELKHTNGALLNEFECLKKEANISNLKSFLDNKGFYVEIYLRNELFNGNPVFSHYIYSFGRNGKYIVKMPMKNMRNSNHCRILQNKLAIIDCFSIEKKVRTNGVTSIHNL